MFIREIPIVAFVVLLPRMSALHALNKMEQLWKIYLAGTKITFAFVGMGLGLLIRLHRVLSCFGCMQPQIP